MSKVADADLLRVMVDTLRQNNVVLGNLVNAAADEAASKRHLAKNIERLTATIQGAQRKIGGEIGPAIDRSKAATKAFNEELRRVREIGRPVIPGPSEEAAND